MVVVPRRAEGRVGQRVRGPGWWVWRLTPLPGLFLLLALVNLPARLCVEFVGGLEGRVLQVPPPTPTACSVAFLTDVRLALTVTGVLLTLVLVGLWGLARHWTSRRAQRT
jgi:hypothetical protein